jgi:hypothetical protein
MSLTNTNYLLVLTYSNENGKFLLLKVLKIMDMILTSIMQRRPLVHSKEKGTFIYQKNI